MGFRISAVVAKCDAETLVAALGLQIVEIVRELPVDEELWATRQNKNGWSILFANDQDFIVEHQDRAAALSTSVPVFGAMISETTMWALVTRYAHGEILWSVDWVGDEGPMEKNLTTWGTPPAEFEAARIAARTAQEDDQEVDHFFEVPLGLLYAETGFRYDHWPEPGQVDSFRIVRAVL